MYSKQETRRGLGWRGERCTVRKLGIFAASFSVAAYLCQYVLSAERWLIACGVCAALLALAFLLLRGKRRLALCLICSGLAVGFLWTHAYDRLMFEPARRLDDQTIRLSAVVLDYPQQRDYGWRVCVRMETEDGPAVKALLYTDEQGESLRPGDRIESVTHCTLGTKSSAGEEITYYSAKGIFLWGKCYGTLHVQRPEHIPIFLWPAHLAHLLKTGIDRSFDEGTAGIIRAVVTGSRDKLTDEFTSSLERTGLSHTVAVSGMHLSCFAGLLAILLGRGKRSTAIFVTAWAVLFSGVAGGTPSVSRAAVMIMLLQLAPLLRRERDDLTTLSFALMLLLIWNPYSAAHVGLQLSFAAVAGIFLLAGPMQQWVMERLGATGIGSHPLIRAAVGILCTTLGAMAATTPLTALHFGSISLIAPLSNLLTLWAMTVLFVLGMAVGLAGLVVPQLAGVLAVPVTWLARYVELCSGALSDMTFSALSLDSPYYRGWLVFAYFILLLTLFWRGKRRVVVPVCCVVLTLCMSITLTVRTFFREGMSLTALDVGQGQSILLRFGGTLALVDCGGDGPDDPGDLAADYIQSRGSSKLDILILTHCHEDHANGVLQLLRRVEVGELFLPGEQEQLPLREEIVDLADELGVPVRLIQSDTYISMGERANITVYPPMTGGRETNELGLTVLASSGEFEALITGDMSGETEQMLLTYAPLSTVELLVAGHHGSNHSTTQTFLDTLSPDVCVISVGAHNRYGHPGEETLNRLTEIGAEVYRTDRHGTITISADHN